MADNRTESRPADHMLHRVRDVHDEFGRLYADAAIVAEHPRVVMLLEYISDGHRQRHAALQFRGQGCAPVSTEIDGPCDFDVGTLTQIVAGSLYASMRFDEVMVLALENYRQLHAALETAADAADDPRLAALLRHELRQSRAMRNRLSHNASLLRDF